MYTLLGTNISHLGKRNIIFKSAFKRGYVSSQEGIYIYYIFALLRKLSSKPTRTSGIFSRWSDKERLRGLSESPFSKMEVYFWDMFFRYFCLQDLGETNMEQPVGKSSFGESPENVNWAIWISYVLWWPWLAPARRENHQNKDSPVGST